VSPANPRQIATSAFTEPIVLLDDTNVRILGELHANPRITMSALGRRVGMSPPAVTERVQRLEQAGVILGYRLDVDPAALGLPVTAFVRIRPAPGQLPKIAELARRLGQVSECHRITGEDCFLVKVHAASVPDLEELLDQFLTHGQTVSSIVVSTPVPPRPLPLPAKDAQDSTTPTAERPSPRSSSADPTPPQEQRVTP
jgi:Lrp/AsnC family transcriptional regulator, leucine-responsive regulatory protein